jgi:hypothetical protein
VSESGFSSIVLEGRKKESFIPNPKPKRLRYLKSSTLRARSDPQTLDSLPGKLKNTFLWSASVARAMLISVQFSPAWYALFVAFFLAWLTLALFRRKGVERKEAKEQFVLGLIGSCALVSMEIFAISTNLWTYVPQNWPVMLWPTYFVAILFGYQLLRLVEGFFSKNMPAR